MPMQDLVINTVARWGITLLVVFILFILSAVPLDFLYLGEIRPCFMLIAVYYMTILRPSVMSSFLVFLIGLSIDFISSYPLGLNALILVAVQWLVRSQRKLLMAQTFKILWVTFSLVALTAGSIQWLVLSLFNMQLYAPNSMIFSVLLSSVVFPLVAMPLSLIHKSIDDE